MKSDRAPQPTGGCLCPESWWCSGPPAVNEELSVNTGP